MRYAKRSIISALAAISFGLSATVLAEDTDRPCQADAKKFCADVKPGGGRLMKCLKEHEAELSPACRQKGQKIHERMEEMHEACKDDVANFCKDVKPGEGRVAKCLKEHEGALSAGCKDMAEHKR